MRYLLVIIGLFQFILSTAQNDAEIILHADLQLIPVTRQVYIHRSFKEYPMGRFASNGMVYLVDGEAILIDTPVTDSLTTILITWFSEKGIEFNAAIPTHWHDDCLGGLGAVHRAGIASYGLNMTIELAKEHNYIPPEIGFSDSLNLTIGKEEIECKFLGAGHALDNIVVWIPAEKILFGGCMVRALSARGLGNTADADIVAWPQTILTVKNRFPDAKYVIPGHGAYGGPELLDHTYQLLTSQ